MVTDPETIRQELRAFINDSFLVGDESTTFGDSDSFMRNGIIDSTGVLELTAFLEERYGFSPDDSEMIPANLDSIDNLVTYIGRKMNGQGGAH
jgi:acyl carrier protein